MRPGAYISGSYFPGWRPKMNLIRFAYIWRTGTLGAGLRLLEPALRREKWVPGLRNVEIVSGNQRNAENGHVTEAVNGDGDYQAFFLLVGNCKHNSTHNLGERQVVSVVVRQYKEDGADKDGRIATPPPEKPENDTSEKYLFPYRTDDTTHKKEYENLMGCRG